MARARQQRATSERRRPTSVDPWRHDALGSRATSVSTPVAALGEQPLVAQCRTHRDAALSAPVDDEAVDAADLPVGQVAGAAVEQPAAG